jgi:lipopolysaccharide assembly outer membrane protein LptD (OstA)
MVRSGETAGRLAERTPARWAALAAALAVTVTPNIARAQTAPPPAPTSPIAPAIQGELVQLEADEIIDDQIAGTITAIGDVQIRYQGRTMRRPAGL